MSALVAKWSMRTPCKGEVPSSSLGVGNYIRIGKCDLLYPCRVFVSFIWSWCIMYFGCWKRVISSVETNLFFPNDHDSFRTTTFGTQHSACGQYLPKGSLFFAYHLMFVAFSAPDQFGRPRQISDNCVVIVLIRNNNASFAKSLHDFKRPCTTISRLSRIMLPRGARLGAAGPLAFLSFLVF